MLSANVFATGCAETIERMVLRVNVGNVTWTTASVGADDESAACTMTWLLASASKAAGCTPDTRMVTVLGPLDEMVTKLASARNHCATNWFFKAVKVNACRKRVILAANRPLQCHNRFSPQITVLVI